MRRQPNGMLSPSLTFTGREPCGRHVYTGVSYRSYRDLRKDLKRRLEESVDGEVSVSRSKRGQGFEWFENWELSAGKPRLVKEGWQ